MERKKFRDYLLLGSALLGIWFLLQRFDAVAGFVQTLWVILSPFVLGAVLAFVLNVPACSMPILVTQTPLSDGSASLHATLMATSRRTLLLLVAPAGKRCWRQSCVQART